ncbi:MAG: hypothetical protein RI885_1173 [Actinomycetota bacterium]
MSVHAVEGGSLVRYPDLKSPDTMTKRGWWLVGVNILVPGSAQLLAGSRRLGRFGVGATFTLWALALIAFAVNYFFPRVITTVASNVIGLTVVQVLLAAYAVLWVILTLDTLRLVRLVRAAPNARPFIAGLAVIVLTATAGAAAYGAVITGSARTALDTLFSDGQYEEPVDGQYNILLMGGDAGADRTGLRPDSLSVVSINADTGATTIVGVPRNFENATFSEGSPLWGPFPNGYDCGDECLINYLYTYGTDHPELYPNAEAEGSNPGIEATRDAVSGVTGLSIQYYVLVDMQGFAQLIDSLGGVEIDVPERTAIGGVTGAEPEGYIEAGVQRMDGATALWYGRTRYDSTDFARMERQRLVQQAMIKQFEPANVLTKFSAIVDAGVQVVKTDVPQVMIPGFVDLATKAKGQPVVPLELVPPLVDSLDPDYDAIHTLVDTTIHPAEAEQG